MLVVDLELVMVHCVEFESGVSGDIGSGDGNRLGKGVKYWLYSIFDVSVGWYVDRGVGAGVNRDIFDEVGSVNDDGVDL